MPDMKLIPTQASLLACTLLLIAGLASAAPLEWTNKEGKTIVAEFVRLEGESVVVRRDGRELTIPLATLSLASRIQSMELGAGKPGKPAPALPQPAPAETAPTAAAPPPTLPDHPAIPKPGTWKNTNAVGHPKPGTDRAFLIDRGWLEGQLLAIDPSSVTMQVNGQSLRLPRNQVSLVGLSDPYDPAKRTGDQDVRLRVVMEGPAECATLHFTQGALISKVLKEPRWVQGADADDKASTSRTSFSFDKGADRSVTRVEAEFLILLPPGGNLRCEMENNRSNGTSGQLGVKFIDPESNREIAVLPVGTYGPFGMWYDFEIDRTRLLKAANPLKLSPLPTKFKAAAVPSLALLSRQPSRPARGSARLIHATEPSRVVLLDGMDTTEIRLGGAQPTRLPRKHVVWIELLDWQLEPSTPPTDGRRVTPPLRWVSFGCSCVNSITLPTGGAFARMIVPPYCLYGMDRGDTFAVRDERILQSEKGDLDLSPFHAEMVATVELPPEPVVSLEIANAYTNAWSGHWEFVILHALSNRWIENFQSGPAELQTSRRIQSAKLMAP